MELHRSPRSILGYVLTFLFSVFVTYLVAHYTGTSKAYWLLLGSLAIALEALRKYHDDLYIFERDQITHRGGRLSLNYVVPSIRYSDIRAIEVTQSIFGRMFDYGNVSIGTASHDGEEMKIVGVRGPCELATALDELRGLGLTPETHTISID